MAPCSGRVFSLVELAIARIENLKLQRQLDAETWQFDPSMVTRGSRPGTWDRGKEEVALEPFKERTEERKRLTARTLKGPSKAVPALQQLGRVVFADGAISKKHKELMALAVAVSQNCFE